MFGGDNLYGRYTWSHNGTGTKLNRDKEIIYVPYPVYVPVYYPYYSPYTPPVPWDTPPIITGQQTDRYDSI